MKRQAVAKAVSWERENSPWWWTVIRDYSESISLHAEQVGPAHALSLNAILHPPTATVHTDTTSSSTQDGRKEEKEGPGEEEEDRKEGWNWPLPLGEGVCVEAEEEEEEEEEVSGQEGG